MKSTTVAHSAGLRVGTGSVNLSADDSMVVAGSILSRHVKGQEGELRAVAIVIEKPPTPKLAIVVCDVIVVTRDDVDAAVSEIERTTGIPPTNILISATHTHHAPSTIVVHGYGRDETFCQHLREGIIPGCPTGRCELERRRIPFLLPSRRRKHRWWQQPSIAR